MIAFLLFIPFAYLLYRIIKVVYRNLSNIRDKIGTLPAVVICIVGFLVTFTLFDQMNSVLSIFFGFTSIGFLAVLWLLVIGSFNTSPEKKQKKEEQHEEFLETHDEFLKDMRSRREKYYK